MSKCEIEEIGDTLTIYTQYGIPLGLMDALSRYALDEGYQYWLPGGPRGEWRFCKEMTSERIKECNEALKRDSWEESQAAFDLQAYSLPNPNASDPQDS